MKLTETQQGELALMEGRRSRYLEHPEIKPLIELAAQGVKQEQGRDMSLWERLCMAQCLQNAREDALARSHSKLFEATTEDAISFLGIQLPVIAALLPSLVLNDIATTQPLDRRIGAVFYLSVLAGSTKGEITAGDELFGAKTGANTKLGSRYFGMACSPRESLGTGNRTYSGTTAIAPGLILLNDAVLERVSTLGVYDTIATFGATGVPTDYDATTGVAVTGTLGSSVGIQAAGTYGLAVSGLDSGDEVLLTTYFQYDLPVSGTEKTGVAEEDITVTQEDVRAIDFPVRTKYSVGAAIDLQKAHGINLEDEMIKYVGGSAKFAIDQKGLEMMIAAADNALAADAVTDWVASIRSGQAWALHCRELTDRFIQGSNNIFKKTQRGVANVCICGNNVARVIRQLLPGFGLEGAFKPSFNWEKQVPTGPINIGNITSVNNMIVVQNPYMDENKYVMAYKGKSVV